MAFELCLVEVVEVVGAELMVGLFGREHVIDDHQHAVRDGHERLVDAAPVRQAAELDAEVGRGVAGIGPVAQATSLRTAFSQTFPPVVFPPRRLPALCLLPGQTPAQEARCLADGKRCMSVPTSATKTDAAISPTPGIVCSSVTAS